MSMRRQRAQIDPVRYPGIELWVSVPRGGVPLNVMGAVEQFLMGSVRPRLLDTSNEERVGPRARTTPYDQITLSQGNEHSIQLGLRVAAGTQPLTVVRYIDLAREFREAAYALR